MDSVSFGRIGSARNVIRHVFTHVASTCSMYPFLPRWVGASRLMYSHRERESNCRSTLLYVIPQGKRTAVGHSAHSNGEPDFLDVPGLSANVQNRRSHDERKIGAQTEHNGGHSRDEHEDFGCCAFV